MRKEIFIHFAFWFSLFVFFSLAKAWINVSFWPFWLGGLIGTLLPDIDHLIYVYFLRPYELTSQRVSYMTGKGEVLQIFQLLYMTRSERKKLIFHTAHFQIIFVVLALLVITSSGSLFGRGVVLAFLIHLVVDQIVDIQGTGGLENWFRQINFNLDKNKALLYTGVNLVVILIFGFLL